MKRFWAEARAEDAPPHRVLLDDRPVRTPEQRVLELPTAALARAIAAEWSKVEQELEPRAMPLTGLANAMIDRIAPARSAFASHLGATAESDLLCYRADGPAELVRREASAWDPLLAWARSRYDVSFTIVTGVLPQPQQADTVERLTAALLALDDAALTALVSLVPVGGSLVGGLALAEGAIAVDALWDALTVDDRYQEEHWGADAEAMAAREARRRDVLAAARFLALTRPAG